MTYILLGQGIRDVVPLDSLFREQPVDQLTATAATAAIPGSDEEHEFKERSDRGIYRALHSYQKVQEEQDEIDHHIHARDIMSHPVLSLGAEASLSEAWETMKTQQIHHVVIVEDNAIIGIVSERDILHFNMMAISGDELTKNMTEITLSEIMKTSVLTATEDTEIRELARVMINNTIGATPIISSQHQLLGIVTRSDILRTLIEGNIVEIWA